MTPRRSFAMCASTPFAIALRGGLTPMTRPSARADGPIGRPDCRNNLPLVNPRARSFRRSDPAPRGTCRRSQATLRSIRASLVDLAASQRRELHAHGPRRSRRHRGSRRASSSGAIPSPSAVQTGPPATVGIARQVVLELDQERVRRRAPASRPACRPRRGRGSRCRGRRRGPGARPGRTGRGCLRPAGRRGSRARAGRPPPRPGPPRVASGPRAAPRAPRPARRRGWPGCRP